MSNKKITAFEYNNNPTLSDVFPIVNNDETKQMTLSGLTDFIGTINTSLTGGTYDNNTGITTLNNSYGDSIKISGYTTNPGLTGGTYDNNTGITTLINSYGAIIEVSGYTTNPGLTGGTYDNNTGIATLINSYGASIEVSGFTTNVNHWEENQNKILKSDETILISGDYVLVDTDLVLQKDTPIVIGDLTFNKFSQIFIGGNLLLKDSNITNDGLINVAGAVIFNGNSTITGTGIII